MLSCHIHRFDSLGHIYRFCNRILFSECSNLLDVRDESILWLHSREIINFLASVCPPARHLSICLKRSPARIIWTTTLTFVTKTAQFGQYTHPMGSSWPPLTAGECWYCQKSCGLTEWNIFVQRGVKALTLNTTLIQKLGNVESGLGLNR